MPFYKFLRKWYDNHYKLQQGGGEMAYTLETFSHLHLQMFKQLKDFCFCAFDCFELFYWKRGTNESLL